MKKRFAILRAGAALAALLAGGAAPAAEFEWKLYTFYAINDVPTNLHRAYAKDLSEASGGRLKITVYAAGELPYKAQDVLRVLSGRQIEVGNVNFGFVSGDAPELNALSMPFVCTSWDKFYDRTLPRIAGKTAAVLEQRFKVVPLVQWAMPAQQLWTTKPVGSVEQMRRLKARTWNREQIETMRLLDGSGVVITSSEVIPALQRGVVDGAFTASIPAYDWKFYEVTKYAYMMDITLGHEALAVNRAAFDKLPPDLRRLVLDKSREWGGRYRKALAEADEQARANLAAKGMTLFPIKDEDRARLGELTRPITADWAAKQPQAGRDILQDVEETCR